MYINSTDYNISSSIIKWYNLHKRDLPWRNTKDPYLIWISEIILQQTRVDQGYDYYLRFIEQFPNVPSLASAQEDEVLKLWQGLGYYSRARNLHAAAKDVITRFNGIFPDNYNDILSLKGIGEYTAAAIVSFAYNKPYAVVDGNVFRVLSRLFAIDEPINTGKGKKLFTQLAQEILNPAFANVHNQAIMEFGALQCIPSKPDCSQCPLSSQCKAFAEGTIQQYPVKEKKGSVQPRYFNYLDIHYKRYTYLNKRTNNDIWKNLYEFPLVETKENISVDDLLRNQDFINIFNNKKIKISLAYQTKHILSHRIIYANFYRIEAEEKFCPDNRFIEIPEEDIDLYPISRLVHKYIETKNTLQ